MSDPVSEQQPVLVYPNGVNVQPQSQTLQSSSHSNKGSFGASFIVLAVIIVVSATACFLSRLCNKSGQKKKHKDAKVMKKGHGGGGPTFPPEQSRRKEMDMEFGFGAARVGPGPVPGRGFDHHHHQQQQLKQGKGNDFEIGFDKKTRQSKGSDIEMGFDRRVGNGKGAPLPPNAEMMRGQQPYHNPTGVMNGEANRHFNGGRWPGGQ